MRQVRRAGVLLPILILSTLLLDSPILQAQTSGWDLSLAMGGILEDVTLLGVAGDTLTIALETWDERSWTTRHDTVRLDVGMIDYASRQQGANFGTGGLVGAGAGAGLIGALTLPSIISGDCEYCGVGLMVFGPVFTVGGFLVGGIIGAVIDDDPEYDLRGKDRPIRAATLHWIITSGRFAD